MRITIAARLKAFSHEAGEKCLIPGTTLVLQAFPSLLIISSLDGSLPKEIARHPLGITGPVKDFTIQQDLEKRCVRVWGHAENGFFRYRVCQGVDQYCVTVEKAPEGFGLEDIGLKAEVTAFDERLFLGCNKQQEWPMIRKRASLAEILPFWLRLGSLTPILPWSSEGTAAFLNRESLQTVFLTGFEGILCPSLVDSFYHGFNPPSLKTEFSPAVLLSEGAQLIRSLFFKRDGHELTLLPNIPRDFHSGRFINVCCGPLGTIDMEWRSRKLRRVIFRSRCTQDILFHFPSALKSFKLRELSHVRGERRLCSQALSVQEGHVYFLDRFEAL